MGNMELMEINEEQMKAPKDATVKKINKFGKIGNIITNICKVFIIIALVGCIAGTIAIAVLPKDLFTLKMNGSAQVSVNLEEFSPKFSEEQKTELEKELLSGNTSINIDGNNMGQISEVQVNNDSFSFLASGKMADFQFGDLLYVLISATITVAMTLVTLIFVGRLCKAFRDCDTPFSDDVIKKMQQLAYSLIPWVILSGITEGIVEGIFKNSSFSFSFNMTSVLTIVIIFGLVYVFKYGAKLQQEADETL